MGLNEASGWLEIKMTRLNTRPIHIPRRLIWDDKTAQPAKTVNNGKRSNIYATQHEHTTGVGEVRGHSWNKLIEESACQSVSQLNNQSVNHAATQ